MFIALVGMAVLTNHRIGGFAEGPFQVVVGLFAYPTIAVFTGTTLNLGSGAGIAGGMIA